MQKYKRRKGSKRWTSAPVIKKWVLDACLPEKNIKNNNKDSPCFSGENFQDQKRDLSSRSKSRNRN